MMKTFLLIFLSFTFSLFAKQPKLHLVTYSNCYRQDYYTLKHTAQKQGITVIPLSFQDKKPGVNHHLLSLKRYLDKNLLANDDIVLVVKPKDILVLRDANAILQAFFSYAQPLVFASEKNCHPHLWLKDYYPKTPYEHRYVNDGGMIGYVQAIKDFLSSIDLSLEDEQELLSFEYVFYLDFSLALDTECKIFLSLHDVNYSDLIVDYPKQQLIYKPTNSRPCILNGNGNGKTMYRIFEQWIRKNSTKLIRKRFNHIVK